MPSQKLFIISRNVLVFVLWFLLWIMLLYFIGFAAFLIYVPLLAVNPWLANIVGLLIIVTVFVKFYIGNLRRFLYTHSVEPGSRTAHLGTIGGSALMLIVLTLVLIGSLHSEYGFSIPTNSYGYRYDRCVLARGAGQDNISSPLYCIEPDGHKLRQP